MFESHKENESLGSFFAFADASTLSFSVQLLDCRCYDFCKKVTWADLPLDPTGRMHF